MIQKIKLILEQPKNVLISFVYQKSLIQTFHTAFSIQITFLSSQNKNTNSKGGCLKH